MTRILPRIMFAASLLLASAILKAEERPPLDFSKVGVYATFFDFCDYSVFKIRTSDDEAYYKRMAERIAEVHAQGKLNLVGLYCFDRLKHSRPIEEYIKNADRMLGAIDLKKVYAVFLSEENVTWSKGLETLNALYGHIKAHYDIPVYQWYSMPMVAHPKQRADGWIIDPYGMKGEQFRKYLMKYVVMGKPVINCAFASPEGKHAGRSEERLAATREQIPICKEFDIPMFFYCVDPKLGSPSVWLKSDEPEIAEVRQWLLAEIKKIHETDATKLPLLSADGSAGQAIPVAGNLDNVYEYEERFQEIREGLIEDASIEGFLLLRWDGEKEALYVKGRPARPVAKLTYHFTSEFDMSGMKATLEGSILKKGARTFVSMSTNGTEFVHGAETDQEGGFVLTSDATADQDFKGKDFWVSVTASVGDDPVEQVLLKRLQVTCNVAPPDRREIILVPDANGLVAYADDFQTQKHLHLSEIENLNHLEWKRGYVGTHAVEGKANVVSLKQKFISEHPLSKLRVAMTSTAHRSLGSYNTLGLSLDDQQPILSESTKGKESSDGGYKKGTLELDAGADDRFSGVREFWVHLTMTNTSTKATGRTSNRITEYKIEAAASKE